MTDKPICNTPLRFLVLDVLKPHKPNLVDFGKALCAVQHMDSVNLTVYAVDEKTESIKMTLVGADLDFDAVKALIEDTGGAVHSIDKVIVGNKPFIEQAVKKSD
jgi:uncharacterized protein